MIAIISDIHSNIEALDAAFRDLEELGAERVYCLGDVIGYGANPLECLRRIRERCPVVIMGNHEDALLNFADDFNENARAAIHWTRDRLNSNGQSPDDVSANWIFLGDLPTTHEEADALYVHGSPRDPVREYMLPRDARNASKMKSVFAAQTRPVCFVGHSHVPGIYEEGVPDFLSPRDLADDTYEIPADRKVLVNVGSVGQPRDGDVRLSYVLYGGGRIRFRRLEYDHRRASDAIRETQGLPDYLADRLLVGR